MTWTTAKYLNQRASIAFVTDGSGQGHIAGDDTLAGVYPLSRTIDGDTFNAGWLILAPDYRDRDAGLDPRFAGLAFAANDGTSRKTLEWDVPAGEYEVRIAIGDASAAHGYTSFEFFDDTGSLFSFTTTDTTPENQYRDSFGTLHASEALWISNNVAKVFTISSGKLKLGIGSTDARTDVTALATISVRATSSPSSPIGMSWKQQGSMGVMVAM